MRHLPLGSGGPSVSCLGIGAMSFADFYGPTTDENSYAILDVAMAAGVTHIDTSNVYGMGRSETAIGAYLAQNRSARDHFVIATKGGINRKGVEGKTPFDNSPAHLEASLDASLKRLGVDCVDLYYAHRWDQDIPIEEVAGTLGRLVETGKARSIGFSEIAPSSLRRAHAEHPVAAVQSEYSLGTRLPELGMVQTCAELGVCFVAFSPVMRSMLTDNPLAQDTVPSLPFLKSNPRFVPPHYATNKALTDPLRAMAAEMGVATAALAIAWVLSRGAHILPIPGTRSAQHFAELVQGTTLSLSDADLARIDAILPVGWAHGDRYAPAQWIGPEKYC